MILKDGGFDVNFGEGFCYSIRIRYHHNFEAGLFGKEKCNFWEPKNDESDFKGDKIIKCVKIWAGCAMTGEDDVGYDANDDANDDNI